MGDMKELFIEPVVIRSKTQGDKNYIKLNPKKLKTMNFPPKPFIFLQSFQKLLEET